MLRAMFDLRPLRHFIRIVDLGSLSRAAQEVGIAQPAISQHVASLEADFGAKLLDRGPRGAKPTEAGLTLYRHAHLLLRQVDEARRAVRSPSADVSGIVTIGLSITTAEILSLPLLRRILAELPQVHLQIVSLPNRFLVDMLINGRLDMAILFGQRSRKGILSVPLAVEEMFFLTPKQRGHRAERPAATFEEVSRHPLLLPCRPHGARLLLEAALTQSGYPFQVAAEVDAVPSLIAAVQAGLGATVLPWSAFHREASRGEVAYAPFAGSLEREVSFCASDAMPPSDAARATRRLIETVIASLVASGAWKGLTPVNGSGQPAETVAITARSIALMEGSARSLPRDRLIRTTTRSAEGKMKTRW